MVYITKQKMFHKEYICKESSSIWDINLKNVHPGSLVVVPEEKEIYILDIDYTWRKKSDGTELEKKNEENNSVISLRNYSYGRGNAFFDEDGIFYGFNFPYGPELLESKPVTKENYMDYESFIICSLDDLSYEPTKYEGIPVLIISSSNEEFYYMGFGGYDYEAGHFYKSNSRDWKGVEISKEEFIEYLKTKAVFVEISIDAEPA